MVAIFFKDLFYHSRWKLSWNNLNFEHLDIKFSVTLDAMEELNYLQKLFEIRKLVNQWKLPKMSTNNIQKMIPYDLYFYFDIFCFFMKLLGYKFQN